VFWKRFRRSDGRALSEYFLGMGSDPNLIGKVWYLFRKRRDSVVKALSPIELTATEPTISETDDVLADSEPLKLARIARRRVLVSIQQEMRVLVGPRFQSVHSVKETLLRDPQIQAAIQKVAVEQNIDPKRVMMTAYQYLGEIA